MLHLVTGPDRLALSDRILQELCVEAVQGHSRQILIVPEQYSHEAERQLCLFGGDTISRYAEVLSFSRLADRVAAIHGGTAGTYLDKGGRVLAMAMAAEQISSRIKYFGAMLRRPEFLTDMLSVIDEFQSYCVDPPAVLQASAREEGQFAQKLEELGLLYEAYLAVCANGKADPGGRLLWLRNVLTETDWAKGQTFHIDGFSDFTGAELSILEALLQSGADVEVALTIGDGVMARPVQETVRRIRRLAEKWEIPVRTTQHIGKQTRETAVELLLNGLFSAQSPAAASSEQIRLRRFSSVEEECRQAAMEVKRLLRMGARCKEIAVACTDMARYEAPLRAALQSADLPFYWAGREEILNKPLLNSVMAALQAAVGPMDYEDVALYLKSGLPLLNREKCDWLDCYAYMWNLRGAQWIRKWELHPRGFGEAWTEVDRDRLTELNADREKALLPLFRLRDGLRNARTTGEMVQIFYGFLEELQLRERLERQANEQGGQRGQELFQLYDILCQSLEQTWLILGQTERTPDDFVRLYRVVLTQYHVGTIPAGLDQIYVGALQDLRQKRTKQLLVLGTEDGYFPSYKTSEGLLTEAERRALLSQGLTLSPLRADQMDHEMCRIHSALSAAQKGIWLSYSGEQPSWLFRRAVAAFPDSVDYGDGEVFLDIPSFAAWRLRHENTSEVSLPQLDRWEAALRKLRSYDFTSLSKDTVSGLYGHQVYLSASRIDKYAACRFAFFLAYGLKVEPRKQARLDPSAFGTFVHAVLQNTVLRIMEEGGFQTISEERLLAVATEEIDAYASEHFPQQAERAAYLFRRSQQEILDIVLDLGEELRGSLFQPAGCELEFSARGDLPPVEVLGKAAACKISGFVDRVDLYEKSGTTYVRVVDYKTGKKDFDYTDILNGAGLQMLIYLFALKQNGGNYFHTGKLVPAGVLYLPARREYSLTEPTPDDKLVSEQHREERRRKGLIHADPKLLAAMERDPDNPRFMPYQMGKNGLKGDLADERQMELLERHVLRTLSAMTDQIASGDVTPNPIVRGQDSSCRFCDYQSVCHHDLCRHDIRPMAATSAQKFWEKLEEGEHHG